MARINAAKKAQKWANKLANAAEDYKDGIDAVTENPAEQAIAKKDAMLARFRKAVENGDWEAALRATGLQGWKDAAKKGAGRLVDGAAKGQAKVQRYLDKAAPEYERIRAEIRAMPNSTDAERTARMLRNQELMKAMKGIGKR